MATSGTVSQTRFPIRKLIDHSIRRAGMWPQKCTAEILDIARANLYTMTSEWCAAGIPLWTINYIMQGPVIGSPEVSTPAGTVEILHAYWRILQPYRGAATLSGGGGDTLLFGGQPNADVVVPGANPSVTVNFTSATETDTVGVLLGGNTPITTALLLKTSTDGITFVTQQTLPSAAFTPGAWTYFNLDPSITTQYLRIQYVTGGTWTLNHLQFGLANGQDILIGPLNIDDYYNLPNKQFQGNQCISGYQDRRVDVPVLKLWPTPNISAFYSGCIAMLTRRYIQDPGAFTNDLEVPQRWLEASIWRLSSRMIDELPDEQYQAAGGTPDTQKKMALITRCETQAQKSELLAWGEERTRGPINLQPSVGCYTK